MLEEEQELTSWYALFLDNGAAVSGAFATREDARQFVLEDKPLERLCRNGTAKLRTVGEAYEIGQWLDYD